MSVMSVMLGLLTVRMCESKCAVVLTLGAEILCDVHVLMSTVLLQPSSPASLFFFVYFTQNNTQKVNFMCAQLISAGGIAQFFFTFTARVNPLCIKELMILSIFFISGCSVFRI